MRFGIARIVTNVGYRFAAKEAAYKAYQPFRPTWSTITLSYLPTRAPYLTLHPPDNPSAAPHLPGVPTISISHDGGYVVAQVLVDFRPGVVDARTQWELDDRVQRSVRVELWSGVGATLRTWLEREGGAVEGVPGRAAEFLARFMSGSGNAEDKTAVVALRHEARRTDTDVGIAARFLAVIDPYAALLPNLTLKGIHPSRGGLFLEFPSIHTAEAVVQLAQTTLPSRFHAAIKIPSPMEPHPFPKPVHATDAPATPQHKGVFYSHDKLFEGINAVPWKTPEYPTAYKSAAGELRAALGAGMVRKKDSKEGVIGERWERIKMKGLGGAKEEEEVRREVEREVGESKTGGWVFRVEDNAGGDVKKKKE